MPDKDDKKDDSKQQAQPAAPKPTPAPSDGGGDKPGIKLESATKPKDKKGKKDKKDKGKEDKKEKKSVLDETVKGEGSYMQEMMEVLKLSQKLAEETKALGKELPGAVIRAPGAIKDGIKNMVNKVSGAIDSIKDAFTPDSKDDNKSSKQNNQNPAMTSVPDSPSPKGNATLSKDDTAAFDSKVGTDKKAPEMGGDKPDEESENKMEL